MKKKNKVWLFIIAMLLILSVVLFTFLSTSNVKSPIPQSYIGNWIDTTNNNWEYGFFEDFVVFESDFWEYQNVIVDDKGNANFTLAKGNENINLALSALDENRIIVNSKNGKADTLVRIQNALPPYLTQDTTLFSTPDFKIDSATIIGYYRNLDKGFKGFAQRFFPSSFEITIWDLLKHDQIKYHADIDRYGRFKITFPVMNTQELLVDWKKTRIRAVVEPKDTLFLFVDIENYIPSTEDKSYESYIDRSKQVLFMGKNARLNNEIYQYKNPWLSVDKQEAKDLNDTEFLRKCLDVYKQRMTLLDKHITENPTVSQKFKIYKNINEKYELGYNLSQHYYTVLDKGNIAFSEDYIQYIQENFTLDNELEYTLAQTFSIFINDYVYYTRNQRGPFLVFFEEIGERLKEEGKLTDDIQLQIDEINELSVKLNSITDEKQKGLIQEELQLKADKLNANALVKEIAGVLHEEKAYLNTFSPDSLIANSNLRELYTTRMYYKWFDVLRKPLSVQQHAIFKEKVKNPDFRNFIDNYQRYYADIANEGIAYKASMKNNDHLKDSKDAEELFNELIKPYKGKVIYLDFWGTWCGPCRRDLKVVDNVKNAFNKEEVIFMYLANNSPESTWENLIKEMKLTGENSVHYRLPAEQQAMVERKFSINNFPTYMLINREGKVVDTDASSPSNSERTIEQIKELLK